MVLEEDVDDDVIISGTVGKGEGDGQNVYKIRTK